MFCGHCMDEPCSCKIESKKETLLQYINRLRDKYSYDNEEIRKIYESDYITGVRDALSFIEYFMENE